MLHLMALLNITSQLITYRFFLAMSPFLGELEVVLLL